MKFKTFDAEKSPSEQGFKEGAYGLVIAFFVLHATSNLGQCLCNLRKLLVPGGFLVVGEGQESQNGLASSGFIFGTLPGWWLGAEAGRKLSPHVSPQEWDDLLKSAGFSGVDTSPPEAFMNVLNKFHFVSQAVNDQVNFFRKPFSSSSWVVPPIKELVIVGGETARSSQLVDKLKAIFAGRDSATEIRSFKALVDVDYELLNVNSTVISLTELDRPIFDGITPPLFEATKKMFDAGKTLVWVTSGRQDDEPFSNMTVGFGRTAANETPGLRLQQLDVMDPQNTSLQTIAEIVLRFHGAMYKDDNLLWTVEPEIVIDTKQNQWLSRLQPIRELNDRYNSMRRPVVRDVCVRETPITVQPTSDGYIVRELSRYEISDSEHRTTERVVELQITHTVLSALKTPLGHRFLALGLHLESETVFLALLPSLASMVKAPTTSLVYCHQVPGYSKDELLSMVAAHLIALAVLETLHHGEVLIAHEPSNIVAWALSTQATTKGVQVIFTTYSTDKRDSRFWVKLPRYLSNSEAKELLLSYKPSSFVGFSSDDIQSRANQATIIKSLLHHCRTFMTAETIYSSVATEYSHSSVTMLEPTLHTALEYVKEDVRREQRHSVLTTESPVRLDKLAQGLSPRNPLSVIDWTVSTSLPVHIARLDVGPIFKREGSTYWIVGMSGALGISLSDWMISKGARYLVLTSRKPDVASEWIENHGHQGATIVVMSWYDSLLPFKPLTVSF